MTDTFNFQITIHHGKNLPKADTFGKIDAYITVAFPTPSGPITKRIPTIKSDYNPVWHATVRASGVLKSQPIHFALWDEDMSKDEKIATVDLNCQNLPIINQDIVLNLESGIKPNGGSAIINVSVGAIVDYPTLKKRVSSWQGMMSNDQQQWIQLPLPYSEESFPINGCYLSIDYEVDGRVDLFILETSLANFTNKVFVGFGLKGTYDHYKIRRMTAENGKAPWARGTLQVYAESKIDDLSLLTPFQQIIIFSSLQKVLWEKNMGDVVTEHGWKGMMNYHQAKQTLKNVVWDDKHESIYFLTPYACLKNDFDSKNADISFSVYSEHFAQGIIADMTHTSTTKRKHFFYGIPKVITNVKVSMEASVDDIPYPVYFSDVKLSVFQHTNVKQVDFLQIFPIF